MPRKPTSAELRRAVEGAGSRDALFRLIDEALAETKPRRGRKRYKERYTLDTLQQLAAATPKERIKIFEQLIQEGRIGGVGQPKSIVERASRNFRKGEKQLAELVNRFKSAFDKLAFTDDQVAQLKDSIRAQIESQQRVKARGYTRPLETNSTGGSHDGSGSRTPSPTKRTRPR